MCAARTAQRGEGAGRLENAAARTGMAVSPRRRPAPSYPPDARRRRDNASGAQRGGFAGQPRWQWLRYYILMGPRRGALHSRGVHSVALLRRPPPPQPPLLLPRAEPRPAAWPLGSSGAAAGGKGPAARHRRHASITTTDNSNDISNHYYHSVNSTKSTCNGSSSGPPAALQASVTALAVAAASPADRRIISTLAHRSTHGAARSWPSSPGRACGHEVCRT